MKKVIVCAMLALSTNAMAFSLGDIVQAGQEVSGAALSREEVQEVLSREPTDAKVDVFTPSSEPNLMSTEEKKGTVSLWD